MSMNRNNNLSLASAATGRASAGFAPSGDPEPRRTPRPTNFAQAGSGRRPRADAAGPSRPAATGSGARPGRRDGARGSRGDASRAAEKRAPRASARPSSFVKYAADNRLVQAVYSFTTGATKPLFIAIVVALVAVGLYGPVRDYYVAWRAGGILEQQVDIREGYNGGLKSEVDSYLTEEGVEDAARRELGLVKEGETRIEVTGGDSASDEGGDGPSTSAEADAAEARVAEETPWHLEVLDAIFGFSGVDGQAVASTGASE